MTKCANRPVSPFRVVIAEHLINEVRFAASAEDAAAAVARDHDLDAVLEAVHASVHEVPGGERGRYVVRAVPVLIYEAEREVRACDADGRRAGIESDSLAAPMRPSPDSPDGCP